MEQPAQSMTAKNQEVKEEHQEDSLQSQNYGDLFLKPALAPESPFNYELINE